MRRATDARLHHQRLGKPRWPGRDRHGSKTSAASTPNTADYTTTIAVGGVAQPTAHVCFSPGGRAFISTTTPTTGAWDPLTDVVAITVTADGRTHNVVVLPNGTARLGL